MYAFRTKNDHCHHHFCVWSIYPAMIGRADSGMIKFNSYQDAQDWYDRCSDTVKQKLSHYHIVKL